MRTIKITATGKASARATSATIHIGRTTIADTASDARVEHARIIPKISQVLTDHRIGKEDIQTSSFEYGINQVHNRQTGNYEQKGLKAHSTTVVKVREFSKIPALLDALSKAGATSITGPNLTIDNPAELEDQARKVAYVLAKYRAGLYANEAGVVLDGIVNLQEHRSQISGGGKFSNAPDDEPEIGNCEVSITVECEFEIN